MIKKYKTAIYTDLNGFTNVIFHSTPVVTFNTETITLNTGGWWTRTTKDRMNSSSDVFNLGFSVIQRNFNWFVIYQGNKIPFNTSVLTLKRGELNG